MDKQKQELLKYAFDNGIIDEDTIWMQVEMKKRQKYLEMHQYSIWQSEKDHYWRTYLPDDEKGRRLLKKKTEESLKDEVVNYYKEQCSVAERDIQKLHITLYHLFPEWLDFKRVHTNATTTIKRICADWQKFYAPNKELINMPIRDLTKVYLDEWVHKMIQAYNMTRKCYYNMTLILRQCLDYAVEKGYVEKNEFQKVKVNQRLLRRTKKKESVSQVYLRDEVALMINEMYRRFDNRPKSTAPLAIVLNFELGLRIGELVAIKESDIKDGCIHIQRQEVKIFEKDGDYQMKKTGYKVVEYTKTEDGDRWIPLTTTARELIDMIRHVNQEYGHRCDGYLFVEGNERLTHYSIERRLARGCETVGIMNKSSHKIRKTVISTMIEAGMNIDDIRRMAGHADERTTYNCYCFSRNTTQETQEQLERALNNGRVINGNQEIIRFSRNKKLQKACE